MTTIGTFRKTGDEYVGEIITLSVQAREVRIVPAEPRSGENRTNYHVFVGQAHIGTGWFKRSNDGRGYLELQLDDPSFAAPIFASLVESENGATYRLIWSRQTSRGDD